MSEKSGDINPTAPLFEPIIPAVELDLPPHGGRKSAHRILHEPCASHEIQTLDIEDIAHPMADVSDAPYRIFRAVPRTPAPAEGWPALYMLDGNAAFDFLSSEQIADVPELVLIGIGQRTEDQFDRIARARDLGFPDQTGGPSATGNQDRPTGGAPEFLPLLLHGLRERAEAGVAINPAKRTIWGHSLAGLFILNLMMLHPDSFARFAAISPSLWLNPEHFDRVLEAGLPYRSESDLIRLYLASGNREKRTGSQGPIPTDAPAAFHALVARLSKIDGVEVSHQVYDGAKHIGSLPTSLGPVLRFATF